MSPEDQVRDALGRLDLLARLENVVTFLDLRPMAEEAAGGAIVYATTLLELRQDALRSAVDGLKRMAAGERAPIRAVAG